MVERSKSHASQSRPGAAQPSFGQGRPHSNDRAGSAGLGVRAIAPVRTAAGDASGDYATVFSLPPDYRTTRPQNGGPGVQPPRDRLIPPAKPGDDLRTGMIASGVGHALVLLAILLGLPDFLMNRPPVEAVVAVKLINVADFTRATQKNPKPVKDAKPDAPPVETPSPKPEPPKKDPLIPPPAPPPQQQAKVEPKLDPPTPPKPEPVKPSPPPPPPPPPPAPKPEPKPEPPKVEPPKPEPKVEPPPPKPETVKPKVEKPKEDQSFDQLLKNLAKTPEQVRNDEVPKRKPQQAAPAQTASAQPNAPLGSQVTTAEKDLVRTQLEECWNPPAGAKDAANLKVEILLQIGPDAVVQSSQIVDTARYASDPFWRAAAESARRATLNPNCNKLKLPLAKYEEWKTMRVFFDPKDSVS